MERDTRLRAKLWPVSVTAAGGMSTSIVSFANWLCLHLGKGEFEGQRLLSPSLMQELQKPRVHVGASEFTEYNDLHYGLGLRSHCYCGERVVWHGGGWTDTNTLMMMPDRGVGIAVFANNVMVPLFTPHSTTCAARSQYPGSIVCGTRPCSR
jgi:CubicO group peptidase (beta-lactamase class C family)